MENKMTKRLLTIASTVIFVIGIVIMFWVLKNGDGPQNQADKDEIGAIAWNNFKAEQEAAGKPVSNDMIPEIEANAVLEVEENIDTSAGAMITFAYWLTLITFIVLIVFGIGLPLAKNPKSMKGFIIFMGALGIFTAIIWFSQAGKEMPTEMRANLSSYEDKMGKDYQKEIEGKVKLYRDYLTEAATKENAPAGLTESKIVELSTGYTDKLLSKMPEDIETQIQSDHHMSGWGILSMIILTVITAFAWIAGGVYSIIKK